ncbi:aminoacyl-tRNA hydrolase [Acidobacteriota bacterium]
MWAVVGLGNPGRTYLRTRHNAGFLLVKKVAKHWDTRLRKRAYSSKVAYVDWEAKKILLALPQTYMNLCGLAVKQIVDSGGVKLENLVVVYDDLDIPLGEIRIRKEGGAGSHKGMISIIQELADAKFPRIRIGIGPLPLDTEATDYVLTPIGDDQIPLLNRGLLQAQEALHYILRGETETAMNLFNQRVRSEPEE